MPPKKAATSKKKKTIKPLDWSVVESTIDEDVSTNEIALEMLNLIVSKGANVLVSHYVEGLAKQQTSKEGVIDCIAAVEWQLFSHDIGERDLAQENEEMNTKKSVMTSIVQAEVDPAVQLSSRQMWLCEKEPESCEIDRFARGMVKVKPKQKNKLQEYLSSHGKDFVIGVDVASTIYAQSIRTNTAPGSVAGDGGLGNSARSMVSNATRGGTKSRVAKKKTETIPETKQPFQIEVHKTQEQIEAEKLREAELRKMDKKRRAVARAKQQNQQEEEDKRRFDKLKNELKGKNYTFDAQGNVILIKPINGDKMPDFSYTPKVVVSDSESDGEGGDKKPKKDKKDKKDKGSKEKAQDKSQKGKRKPADIPVNAIKRASRPKIQHFVDAGTVAAGPSTDMPLQKGVTLRNGNVATKSKAVAKEVLNMTRKEYNSMLNEKSGTLGATRKNSLMGADETIGADDTGADSETAAENKPPKSAKANQDGADSADRPESAPEPQTEEHDQARSKRPSTNKGVQGSSNARKPGLQANNFLKPVRRKSEEEAIIIKRSNEIFDEQILKDPAWGAGNGGFQSTNTKIPIPPSSSPSKVRPVPRKSPTFTPLTNNKAPSGGVGSQSQQDKAVINGTEVSIPFPHLPALSNTSPRKDEYRKDWGKDKEVITVETTDKHSLYFGRGKA